MKNEFEVLRDKFFLKHEVTDNNQTRKAFQLAWDYGHSNGESEIDNYFYDLVDLIKTVK